MKGKEISLIIKQKSSNLTELAEAIGTKPSHIHNVIHRKVVSRPIAEKISRALQLDFEKAFPDYSVKDKQKEARKKRIANFTNLVNS